MGSSEGSNDSREFASQSYIQSSEKHVFQKFSDFFQSDNNTYDEMMSMYDNCVRIHTHSCEESHYSCLKRKDLDGKKFAAHHLSYHHTTTGR